jgi:hypothetical protein
VSYTGEIDGRRSHDPAWYGNGHFSATSVDGSGFWTAGSSNATATRPIGYIAAGTAGTATAGTVTIW